MAITALWTVFQTARRVIILTEHAVHVMQVGWDQTVVSVKDYTVALAQNYVVETVKLDCNIGKW